MTCYLEIKPEISAQSFEHVITIKIYSCARIVKKIIQIPLKATQEQYQALIIKTIRQLLYELYHQNIQIITHDISRDIFEYMLVHDEYDWLMSNVYYTKVMALDKYKENN